MTDQELKDLVASLAIESKKTDLFVIYRYLLEKYLAPIFLKKVKAFIGVTQEIIEVEKSKIKLNKNNT
jgi:hypothetical protein